MATRMAGSSPAIQELVNTLYTPYGRQDASNAPANAGYIGRTQREWMEENDYVRGELEDKRYFGKMKDHLLDLGWDETEAHGTASEAANQMRNRGRVGQLRVERYGVPNAAADEAVNQLALELSGFDNVRRGPFKGTDFFVDLDGRMLGVDSQMRLDPKRSFAVPVIGTDKTTQKLLSEFNSDVASEMKLKEFIAQQIDEGRGSVWADKLLHDHLLHQELFGKGITQGKVKDLIISSDRGDFNPRPIAREYARRVQYKHGPYNPERPRGLDMVDLKPVRNLLLNEEIGNLKAMGIYADRSPQNEGGLRLKLPHKIASQLGGRQLDPAVVQALIKRTA